MLADWDISGGLLGAGASTLLAFGPEAWPVELAGGSDPVIWCGGGETVIEARLSELLPHAFGPGALG